MTKQRELQKVAPSRRNLLTARIALAAGAPIPNTAARRRPYIPAKAVGQFVPSLTKKAFEKHGFATASLLTEWPRIVGDAIAAYTSPERLKWPRGVETFGETGADGGGRPGATLLLRVDPARALDIEYRGRQVLERINAFFGYRAVAELRILQAPLEAQSAPRRPAEPVAPAARPQPPAAPAANSGDLDAALARLAGWVKGPKPRS